MSFVFPGIRRLLIYILVIVGSISVISPGGIIQFVEAQSANLASYDTKSDETEKIAVAGEILIKYKD